MMHQNHRKLFLYITLALLSVAVAAMMIGYWLSRPEIEPEPGKTVEEMLEEDDEGPAPIYMNGSWYQERPNVESYLFLGVDQVGEAGSSGSYNGGGQADVMFLLVLDRDLGQYTTVQLDRDTMTEVEILGVTGDVVGSRTEQLGMAHGYGDGTEQSCENTVRAVSNLLYGIEIHGYASLRMDSIPILNDLVGGVTVTIEDDFSSVSTDFQIGQTVHLTGEQAYKFLRGRLSVGDGTNIARMRRHRQYLKGFASQLDARLTDNASFINDCYAALKPYMVTNLSSGAMTKLGQVLRNSQDLGSLALEGTSKQGEVYMEFYADDDSIQELILKLYYQNIPET